jgi:hypothetical protein
VKFFIELCFEHKNFKMKNEGTELCNVSFIQKAVLKNGNGKLILIDSLVVASGISTNASHSCYAARA